jgi:hypothetical protein
MRTPLRSQPLTCCPENYAGRTQLRCAMLSVRGCTLQRDSMVTTRSAKTMAQSCRRASVGRRLVGLIGCFSLLSGCAWFQSPEAAYLKSAVHQATMDDVRHRLGLPRTTSPLTGGRTRWLYRVREDQPGDLNGPGKTWCNEYHLIFDHNHRLQQWDETYFALRSWQDC